MESDDRQKNGPEEPPTGPTEEQPTGPTGEQSGREQPTGEQSGPEQPTGEQSGPEQPTGEQSGPEQPTEEQVGAAQPTEEPTGPERPTGGQPPPEEPTAERAGPQAPASERPQTPSPRRRLTRSREDRVIAGVCGGVGRYFNIDPVFVRIGAVGLAFVGGAGVLLYLAALLLMPSDDGGAVVTASGEGRNRVLVIVGVGALLLVAWPFLLGGGLFLAGIGIPLALLVGAGVLVWWLVSGEGPSGDAGDVARRAALGIGILVLCAFVFFGGAIAAAAGPDWLVPAFVLAAGAAIVVGAFVKPIRWLVLPALALALASGTVAASGIDFDGGVGELEYRPASSVDLRDRYELGMGELVVDLRETRLPAGDVPLELDVGLGEATVIVPDDVCVATSADIGVGNVSLFGRDNGGIDVDFEDLPDAAPDVTRLVLDAEIGMGEVRVEDLDPEFEFRDRDFGRFDGEVGGSPNDNAACEGTGERASG
jgi:phage shock protein PspC (stress-responsive transcriptional regulator)